MSLLIGLSGKMHSGKDLICETIDEAHRLAFADGVKREVGKACNLGVRYIEARKDVFRPVLQWWGTEFRRDLFGEDYWVKKMREKIRLCESKLIMVTDVRFPNEADMIQAQGGYILRVNRQGTPLNAIFESHPSENAMDDYPFDAVIENNGTIELLRENVERVIDDFRNRIKRKPGA